MTFYRLHTRAKGHNVISLLLVLKETSTLEVLVLKVTSHLNIGSKTFFLLVIYSLYLSVFSLKSSRPSSFALSKKTVSTSKLFCLAPFLILESGLSLVSQCYV